MKAIVRARVSTKGQEEGHSIAAPALSRLLRAQGSEGDQDVWTRRIFDARWAKRVRHDAGVCLRVVFMPYTSHSCTFTKWHGTSWSSFAGHFSKMNTTKSMHGSEFSRWWWRPSVGHGIFELARCGPMSCGGRDADDQDQRGAEW